MAVAARNAARHGVVERLELLAGSWWHPLRGRDPFHLVVANPPYVDPDHPELLGPGVAEFEPSAALFTPPGDPAAPYRAIAAGLEEGLAPGGALLLETGIGAADAALEGLRGCQLLEEVVLSEDDAGLPRYLSARRTPG